MKVRPDTSPGKHLPYGQASGQLLVLQLDFLSKLGVVSRWSFESLFEVLVGKWVLWSREAGTVHVMSMPRLGFVFVRNPKKSSESDPIQFDALNVANLRKCIAPSAVT